MTVEDELKRLGIVIPSPPAAVASYEPWVLSGSFLFTSGQLPWQDGEILFPGRLGAEISEEQGFKAARQCAINAIAQIKDAIGDLERVRQIVKIDGYLHAAPKFRGHPNVLNGASDLINEVFGPRGKHARLAIGVNEMPLDAPCQICILAEVTQ